MTVRCAWVPGNDQLYIQYHDLEWGVPVDTNDQLWFEFLVGRFSGWIKLEDRVV